MKIVKLKSQFAIASVCCILGFILTYQLKSVAQQEITAPGNNNNADITDEIQQLDTQKSQLQSKIDELQKKVDEYEKESASTNNASKELYSELEKSRMISGEVDVEGEGIVITISPKNLTLSSDFQTGGFLTHEALVYVVNELNFAGAEAISINGIRITNYTGIRSSSGGTYIFIGREKISPNKTIEIMAIGDKEKLYKDISFPGVFQFIPSSTYAQPTVEKRDKISISKSNEAVKFTYGAPVKD